MQYQTPTETLYKLHIPPACSVFQMCNLVSTCGLTKDLYRLKNTSSPICLKLLQIVPKFLLALLTDFVTWFSKLHLLSMCTHRFHFRVTIHKILPLTRIGLDTCKTLHLLMFSFKAHLLDQSNILSKLI